tara:strand:+ start:1677 stop:2045 length:369 start_codon:yes stop_codon:yes gene_type:complete
LKKGSNKGLKFTVLVRYTSGQWKASSLPQASDIVQDVDGSKIYKMNTMFGVSTTSNKDKSQCAEKSKSGDFLIKHLDGSLTTLKKSEYSKYFPKQPVVKKEGTVSSKALRNKEYLTKVKKNS